MSALKREGSRFISHLKGVKWAEALLNDKATRQAFGKAEFNKIDIDGSNSIDRKEILKLITEICARFELEMPKLERVNTLYELCDKNGDNVLQTFEFLTFFKAVLESAVKKAKSNIAKFNIKQVGGSKNGETRQVPSEKAPKYYPADDVLSKEMTSREFSSRGVAKLRASITPGTVLILLAGRFRGRRVVFLKQLASGLLLVTGPYEVNGVPARRVNQAYVIATSAKVDISKVKAADYTDDSFGKKTTKKKRKRGEDDMFAEEAPKSEGVSEEQAKKQKTLDAAIKVDPLMAKYLKAKFSLSKRDAPHQMKF